MKKILSKIHTLAFLVLILVSALPGYSQQSSEINHPELTGIAKARRGGITASQSGTVSLIQGKAEIKLNEETLAKLADPNFISSYQVVITPISSGAAAVTLVAEKSKDSFWVRSASSEIPVGLSFDYVVFINVQPRSQFK